MIEEFQELEPDELVKACGWVFQKVWDTLSPAYGDLKSVPSFVRIDVTERWEKEYIRQKGLDIV